ncbi:hypothetical protein Gorai_017039, partial [Gossypium raimondii]|nr:hypothetical protein [Gossypium raimondii]
GHTAVWLGRETIELGAHGRVPTCALTHPCNSLTCTPKNSSNDTRAMDGIVFLGKEVSREDIKFVSGFRGFSQDMLLTQKSLIILLPKVSNPESYAQFRLISLYSVLYKLVIKIIVNRFKAWKKLTIGLGETLLTLLSRLQNLGKYLGVLFFHERVMNSSLRFIVDKSLMIPQELSEKIECLVWKFIWGTNGVSRKVSLVSWQAICQPKACGGSKYRVKEGIPEDIPEDNIVVSVPSFGDLFLEFGLFFETIYFDCSLKELVIENKSWNMDMFWVWLSNEITKCISAYQMFRERSWNSRDDIWRMVWKFPQPRRVWLFLWLAFKERLLTQVERVRQGLGDGEYCIVCGNAPEDVVHTFRNCSATKEWSIDEMIKTSYSWALQYTSSQKALHSMGLSTEMSIIDEGNWVILNTDGAVKLNSKLATDRGESLFTTSSSAFIQHIQQNLLDIRQWKLEYIPREMNFEVDHITKIAFDRNKDLH